PRGAASAFPAQVTWGGCARGLAAKDKSIDTAMAGFTSKNAELPNPFDVPADGYRKSAEAVARSLFVGEVRVPAKSFGDFAGKVRTFGDQTAAKAGVYGSLRHTGLVAAVPFFSAPT